MYLQEFLNLGSTCKVCGNTDPKSISVRKFWDETPLDVELKADNLEFKVGYENCYTLFKFSLHAHKATRQIHNPNSYSMMYCNNFIFKVSCPKCESYSFESSLVTYHPMGSLTSDINVMLEEISVNDNTGWYRIKNLIHTDRVTLSYSNDNRKGTMEIPFMTLRDFPIRSKAKMLKKIRTLMLLS